MRGRVGKLFALARRVATVRAAEFTRLTEGPCDEPRQPTTSSLLWACPASPPAPGVLLGADDMRSGTAPSSHCGAGERWGAKRLGSGCAAYPAAR